MADYAKMYALLCGAIDDAIVPLEQIPAAVSVVNRLRCALEKAEELYITSSQDTGTDAQKEE